MKKIINLIVCLMVLVSSLNAQKVGPDNPRIVELDRKDMQDWLSNAPMEFTEEAKSKMIIANLPLPGGNSVDVRVVKSLVGPQALYDKLEDVMTYSFQGIDDLTISGRMSISPKGLEVFMFTSNGTVYVEAVSYGSSQHKVFYSEANNFPHKANDAIHPEGYEHKHSKKGETHEHDNLEKMLMTYNIGAQRREFNMHVIADMEYSVAVCGGSPTRACVEAAILTAVNAMNALYIRDMSVKLNIGNNSTIYLTGNPAGFAPAGGANDPDWLQESVDHHLFMETNTTGHNGGAGADNPMVPRASYDVGHMFSGRVGNLSGGGGVAQLSAVCNNNDNGGTTGPDKAAGGSGVPNPQGNSWVNLLAHEFTHQFNADHTWTGNSDACTASQFSGPPPGRTAYEPGGGSTIVSYSDICADDNIPNLGNIDYYHTISIKEVDDYIESTGVTCETNVASGNSVPVPSANSAGCNPNWNLPIRTPFIIKGSATDANDPANQLTYTWEQFNKADDRFDPINGPTTTNGSGEIYPIIRSFFPSISAERMIPQMSTILSGNYNGDAQNAATLTQANWQGELLPEVTSSLIMRLTVRDNNAGSGGVEHADATITVTNSGGPFAVTSPNGGENRTAGVPFNVLWNKVGTDGNPFNCANVDIHLSTNGGNTYPTSLGSHTNDGSASVTIPGGISATGTARIRVSCGNDCFRFFDISNTNFNILAGNPCTPPVVTTPAVTQPTCATPTGTIVVNATGGPGPLEYSVDNGASWQASNTFSNLNPDNYNIKVRLQNDPNCMSAYAQNPVVLNAPTGCCTPPVVTTPTVTQPTCANSTGTIVVNATGGPGPLEYSVDNGASWQASNTFSGLNPGNYNIKVRLQNDPNCMSAYAQNPVVLNAPTGCCTPPVVTPVVTNETCPGANDGSITINAMAMGCNGVLEYSLDGGAFGTSNVFMMVHSGPHTIVVRCSTDPNCTTTVTATVAPGVDTTPPVIDPCIPEVNLPCGAMIPPAATTEGGFDFQGGDIDYDCGPVTVSSNDVPSGDECTGLTIMRTYTVTETSSGLTATCTQTITIAAADPPMITAPADVTCTCLAGVNAYPHNAVVDNPCDIDAPVTVSGPVVAGGAIDCPGTTYTYIYAVDACNQTDTDDQEFMVQNGPPVFDNCPENCLVLNCEDEGWEYIIQAWLANVSAKTSCGVPLEVENNYDPEAQGRCIMNGTSTVTWSAKDQCQRTSTCTNMIIIADTEPPHFIEDAQDKLDICNYNTSAEFDAWVDAHGNAQAYDGCWGDDLDWSTIPNNPSINCSGMMGTTAVTVTFVARDGCGNKASTTATFKALMTGGDIVEDGGEGSASTEASADKGFSLFQNQPNPFRDETVISFNLPQAMSATLTVYDISGKVLKAVEGDYSKGYNEVPISYSDLYVAGLLYYELRTETHNAVKKMVIVE